MSDHHERDRGRMARTIEQTRERINSDHPCCIPIGDAVWMLHAYDELKLKYESEKQSVDILEKNTGRVAEYVAELEHHFEALLNTIGASTSPRLRKVWATARVAYKNLRERQGF